MPSSPGSQTRALYDLNHPEVPGILANPAATSRGLQPAIQRGARRKPWGLVSCCTNAPRECVVLRKSHPQPACKDRLSEQAKGNPMKPPKDTTEPPASLWSPLKNTVFNYIPILKSRHRAIDGGGFLTMRGGGWEVT